MTYWNHSSSEFFFKKKGSVMKFSLSIVLIIFAAVVTLNGCSKQDSKTASPKTEPAPAPVQVVIPKVPKTVTGEFVESSQGDYVCGLLILDSDKKQIELSATFTICDDAKIKKGSIYKFTYIEANIPDCDCQGNFDCDLKCKKTRKEERIDSAELVK